MKKLLPLMLALALTAPAALPAAGFEGKLSIKITGPEGQGQQLNLSVKDTLTRMEIPAGPAGSGAMILDSAKREMTILMLQQRMYMVRALPEPAVAPAAGPSTEAKPEEPKLEKTGVTEKILGYDCTKYVAKDNGATVELWSTDQLGTFSLLGMSGPGGMAPGGRGGRGGSKSADWEHLLHGKDLFPLRVVSTAADGKVSRFEVVSLEKGAQPAADFAPPADFQDMSQMMKSMGMPGGMRPPTGR